MLENEFEKIAEEEDATLTIQEEKIDVGGGERSPNLVFLLTIQYKGKTIHIQNSTGTYFSGRISCIISSRKEYLEFKMTTKSHFLNLFSRKKDRFKLISKSLNIKSFIENSAGLKKLKTIANDTMFDPIILGENIENKYLLITEYHLQFTDWTTVIQPLILFYKEFIDRFE